MDPRLSPLKPLTRVHARAGAALILALVMLVVLECIVIGTLQLAILERRMAEHAAAALRLRLAAEGAAHVAYRNGAAAMETLAVAAPARPVLVRTTPPGVETRVTLERVAPDLYLFRAEARERPPGFGRALAARTAALPGWPFDLDPATAAATAGGPVRVRSGGSLTAAVDAACEDGRAPPALLVPSLDLVRIDAGGRVSGPVAPLEPERDISSDILRLIEDARSRGGSGLRLFERDTAVTLTGTGVVIAEERLVVTTGSTFTGVVLVRAGLLIDSGARLSGAVFAGDTLEVAGDVAFDGCAARAAVEHTGLRTPRPAAGRARIPAF